MRKSSPVKVILISTIVGSAVGIAVYLLAAGVIPAYVLGPVAGALLAVILATVSTHRRPGDPERQQFKRPPAAPANHDSHRGSE